MVATRRPNELKSELLLCQPVPNKWMGIQRWDFPCEMIPILVRTMEGVDERTYSQRIVLRVEVSLGMLCRQPRLGTFQQSCHLDEPVIGRIDVLPLRFCADAGVGFSHGSARSGRRFFGRRLCD